MAVLFLFFSAQSWCPKVTKRASTYAQIAANTTTTPFTYITATTLIAEFMSGSLESWRK